ncbi:Low density lipoprotein B-like protein [Dioscorea alata]|uniref:Low density lipoprotein B-like protein n=2 Tax=Dioscorea alata TaxID=55571 RepID=A0ACB7VHF4_DIOAL|nr:Low density lipoprotein B-like protein [Dioscorea alata]KAH7673534.1 Low density lipoprotein B-like protein [Dioscorea alata]
MPKLSSARNPSPRSAPSESSTRLDIDAKSEELRQLVGRSYRDLIDSADSILLMRSSCDSISSNLSLIASSLSSLSSDNESRPPPSPARDPGRARTFAIAARVKYLVDTSENIWGCLDESMLLEAAGRYLRARAVHGLLVDTEILSKFRLLAHQWQIVESFRPQISLRSRERLSEPGLAVASYADALAAAATIDDLSPQQILSLFLDSRRLWISQKVAGSCSNLESFTALMCDVVRIIRASLGQVGELFVLALNEMPLFYKKVLGSPPGTQLFGGIPNPEEEVRIWKSHRERLESAMVLLEPEFLANTCSSWLKDCCDEIFEALANGKRLIDVIENGHGLASAEKLVHEALVSREELEASLEQWLKSVFGSEIESPWSQICGLILKDGKDILEDRLEEAFLRRMKEIVLSSFEDLRKTSVKESVEAIVARDTNGNDFQAYLKKPSTGGGVWFSDPNHRKAGPLYSLKPISDEHDFKGCLNAYFGPEVGQIRDAVDTRCGRILDDVLCFVESFNSTSRLKEVVPYLQDSCYNTISAILRELEDELGQLSDSLVKNSKDKNSQPSSMVVERSLFIGRLLFALRNHSSHIPLILGSPRQWVKERSSAVLLMPQSPFSKQSKVSFDSPVSFTPRLNAIDGPRSPRRQFSDSTRRQMVSAAAALFVADDGTNPKFDELNKRLQELCVKAHSLWIRWVSDELSSILSNDLRKDDMLSSSTALQGWETTVIKQEDSSDGTVEMKISLPSMPSLYITSFIFQSCLEIHKVGGHVLDKIILQNFAWRLLKKVVAIYADFTPTIEAHDSRVSEKGVLQILLDLRFCADVLSGGRDPTANNSESDTNAPLPTVRRMASQFQSGSLSSEPVTRLIHRLSQRLDPIDWATYEPYLWENEKQSYKRYAVLFGFLVQLNRMYTDTVQKLPTKSNTDSNILRCGTVPRFKYLPISAPVLSSRGMHKSALQSSTDDASLSLWKTHSNGQQSPKPDMDDTMSFGVATPLLKSFMTQVGSKFGESTSRWGSMLSADSQVSKFKGMSTIGDMLPAPAAGLFSSLAAGASKFES